MLNVIKLNFFLREYKNKAIYQKKKFARIENKCKIVYVYVLFIFCFCDKRLIFNKLDENKQNK